MPSLKKMAFGWSFAVALFVIAALSANVFLYEEWDAVLNRRAIGYLRSPRALLDSVSLGFQILAVIGFSALSWLCFVLLQKLVFSALFWPKSNLKGLKILAVALVLSIVAAVVRGSLGVMPINESAAYFSESAFANHAAVNPIWHLGHDLIERRADRNRFVFFKTDEARKLVEPLLEKDSSMALHRSVDGRPNVVLILMESMNSQVFDEPGLCPNLRRLAREGIFFDSIYSSGFRTDQGLVAALCGYPAQPDQSILMLSDKAAGLPSLPKFFRKQGYSTAFFYGGELTFANVGVFLREHGFQKIVSEADFSAAEKRQRWGADDENLFDRTASELARLPQPFFATALTLSLHVPFDVPGPVRVEGSDEASLFRNSAAFADEALGRFFEKIEGQRWADSTVFVVMADHGHGLPGHFSLQEAQSRRIPFLIFGKKINLENIGKVSSRIGCQHDLPATLLGLFGAQSADFEWSKDLLSERSSEFAYWTNDHVLGWKDRAGGERSFDFASQKWSTKKPAPQAQAFLQLLYDDFLAR